MPSPLTLPIVAGLSILGGLGGIWLGHSAIDQVNPSFFSASETRFHADSIPYRSPDWAQVRATEEALSAGSEIVSCTGCLNWPEEYRPIRDAAFRGFEGGSVVWPAETATESPAPEPAVAAVQPDPEWKRVQAYASYPIDSRDRRSASADAADTDDEIVAAVDEGMDAQDEGGTD
jgi:hypothetical protein